MLDVLIIIPTYNEAQNITAIIRAVIDALKDEAAVLVVDDNSPDGTADIVRGLMAEKALENRLFLLSRTQKDGLGAAYIAGFKWALARPEYAYIFEMDADFSHHPRYLAPMLAACREGGADFAVGSRYVAGGSVKNWDFFRILISRTASLYTRIITGMPIADPTAGFVCWTARVLRTMNLDKLRFKGYAFQIEMKFTARALGFKGKEVPIHFVDRQEGVSKMSTGIVSEGIRGVLSLQYRRLFTNYKKEMQRKV